MGKQNRRTKSENIPKKKEHGKFIFQHIVDQFKSQLQKKPVFAQQELRNKIQKLKNKAQKNHIYHQQLTNTINLYIINKQKLQRQNKIMKSRIENIKEKAAFQNTKIEKLKLLTHNSQTPTTMSPLQSLHSGQLLNHYYQNIFI